MVLSQLTKVAHSCPVTESLGARWAVSGMMPLTALMAL